MLYSQFSQSDLITEYLQCDIFVMNNIKVIQFEGFKIIASFIFLRYKF
jgi:hypothetical protein